MIFGFILIYIVTLIYISITERYRNYSLLIGIQGWVLSAIVIMQLKEINLVELIFIITETVIFKALLMPYILMRIIKRSEINRSTRSDVSVFYSVLFSLLAMISSIGITYYIADKSMDIMFFGIALFALITGLILITTHKRIFTHIVGFMVVENGVFLFSLAIGVEMPFLINIAILLDILMSVLMLGVFVNKISDTFHTLDSDELTSIKD